MRLASVAIYVALILGGVRAAPAEGESFDTPVQDDPSDDVPVIDEPTDDAPLVDDLSDDAPIEDTPVQDDPIDDAPVIDEPTDDVPMEDAPVKDDPIDDALIKADPRYTYTHQRQGTAYGRRCRKPCTNKGHSYYWCYSTPGRWDYCSPNNGDRTAYGGKCHHWSDCRRGRSKYLIRQKFVGQNFVGQNFSSYKIFVIKPKIRKFC